MRSTVVVVGGGIVGATAFDALVSAGHDVTLVERAIVAGGITAWSGGVVRCLHAADAELSQHAIAGLRHYQALEGFQKTGFLYFPAPEDRELVRAQVEAMQRDIAIAWLERDELMQK